MAVKVAVPGLNRNCVADAVPFPLPVTPPETNTHPAFTPPTSIAVWPRLSSTVLVVDTLPVLLNEPLPLGLNNSAVSLPVTPPTIRTLPVPRRVPVKLDLAWAIELPTFATVGVAAVPAS